jgi:hypothetical protein
MSLREALPFRCHLLLRIDDDGDEGAHVNILADTGLFLTHRARPRQYRPVFLLSPSGPW